MKKLLSIILIMVAVNIFGQDVNSNVYTTFYRDTLTATIDTVQLKFQQGFDYFTISIYSSGTDTVHVYTKGEGDYGLWTRKALIDLSNSSVVTEIIATSTVKEYLIQDPSTMWLRLITPDVSAGAIFTINAKKGQYAVSGATPYSLPLPSGAATSANQTTLIAKADSTVDMVTAIHGDVDTVEEKLDSLDASTTRIEGYVDGVEAKLDTLEVTANAIQTGQGTTNTKLDSLDAVNTRSEVLLTDIKSSLTSYARYFGAINNDTTSATDTVTFGSATSWAKFTLDAVADTLEWSLDGTNWHSLLPAQSFTTPEKLSITYFSEIYIKPRNVGTITYSYVWVAY